ncbi:MAG TPA: hypothetical protein VFN68_03110 [Acidimicrobiales bacterium]|nr:hypothetical protein [Acidimicrobiales bacterium]
MARERVALIAVSLVGLAMFSWPLFAGVLPGAAPMVALSVSAAAALTGMEIATRRIGPRGLALMAALAALDAAARAAVVTGIGGFSPFFLLVLCGGYVFGASYGFLLGAFSLLVSALVTGGVGPWLPYQLFAAGWVGAAAGMAGRRRHGRPTRWDVAVLVVIGVACGYGFGAVMDVWNWTFYQSSAGIGFRPGMPVGRMLDHFGRFYVATSLVYDTFRAGGNAVMVAALGSPVLIALARVQSRMRFTIGSDRVLDTP